MSLKYTMYKLHLDLRRKGTWGLSLRGWYKWDWWIC